MKINANVKAGQPFPPAPSKTNHNLAMARKANKGLRVKTNVKAGIIAVLQNDNNHNQAMARKANKGLRIKTNVKAGIIII
jgi:hypothetical protein